MSTSLEALFETVVTPAGDDAEKPFYAVLPVPGYQSYFVGKDHTSCACLLVATFGHEQRQPPPIRLKSLDVQFELPCHLKKGDEPEQQGRFTVIRCTSFDHETVRYFLSVCDAVLSMVGDDPGQSAVALAVNRLAAIFQKTQRPPVRTVNGMFGELFLISISANPVKALAMWRIDETARFDFVDGYVRLDVKTASGRVRAHILSYEQCNPPPGMMAVAASMFVERVSSGLTLRLLVEKLAALVSSQIDLVFKLHDVTAATLGTSLNEAMSMSFDDTLAKSSLRFFNLDDVPAIKEPMPVGVSDVRFRSDFSATDVLSVQDLIDRDPVFWDLLPRQTQS